MLRHAIGKRSGQTGYVSEFTRFMDDFLEHHPEVIRSQQTGMNIFWDHEVDLDDVKKAGTDSVPVRGYGYF